jgi:hypothetical protein
VAQAVVVVQQGLVGMVEQVGAVHHPYNYGLHLRPVRLEQQETAVVLAVLRE